MAVLNNNVLGSQAYPDSLKDDPYTYKRMLEAAKMSDWDLVSGQAAQQRPRKLIDMVRDRWAMSYAAMHNAAHNFGANPPPCPAKYIHSDGETVYVLVIAGKGKPEMVEDQACMFPSDALMARLHLANSHGNK